MKHSHLLTWITLAGLIGLAFGIFYTLFGLEGLPVYQKFVPESSMTGWSQGLYGAVFVGFSVLLVLVGRRAIQQRDRDLGKLLLYGIGAWLGYEALISLIYGVYINVLVDIVLLVFLSYPVLKGTRK